jgi:hypothetical protein
LLDGFAFGQLIARAKHLLNMPKLFRISALVFLPAVIFLSGCASDVRNNTDTRYMGGNTAPSGPKRAAFDDVSYWDGDGVPGKPHIIIKLAEQRAYFYKGDQLVGVSILSTGREGLNTRTGHFKIIQKDKDHKSSQYGDYILPDGTRQKDVEVGKDPKPPGATYDGAAMPFFMRIVGGTGMHAGFLPGYPASHCCIRMPEFMAEDFFNNVELGTPVEIDP